MKHLSPLDYQLLLEGEATPDSVQHLAVCGLCQTEFRDQLRAEAALLSLGRSSRQGVALVHQRPARAPERTPWDEVSGVHVAARAQRSNGWHADARRMLGKALLVAACIPFPWVSFITAPPQVETALTTLQASRCVNAQPWCR